MSYNTIEVQKDGPALVITLNRPESRNSFSVELMGELAAAAKDGEQDPDIFGVIVTGGDKYFASGADLNEALALTGPKSVVDYMSNWEKLCRSMEELEIPVIAAIEGFCMTGGAEFILACDMRVGAEGSSYAITSARIGTVAGAGGTQRLPRIVGMGNALEIMLMADPISAEEAYRVGLLNKLTPKGGALAKAREMVGVLAERAPLSLAWVKRVVYNGMQMDLRSAIDYERFIVTSIYQTSDRKEGIGAFLEKRPAKFKGE
ncbi:MAG: enoyl-CoA hydratase/isomerase family protein [Rickettsiales bacterium]|jgi:enoyl-CoA hydratase/carnithine racemase